MIRMEVAMKRIFLSLAILSACAYSAMAQEGLSTFKDPVEKAIQYNKSLKNAALENQKVALDREMVKGKLLPTVSANAMYGYINSLVDVDLPTQQLPITGINLFEGSQKARVSSQIGMAGVTATQVIFSGLQISNGQKALAEKFKAQQFLQEAGYDQVAQEVIMSFDQLMLLNEVDVLIADSEKRLNKEHLKVVQAIANGLAIPYDRDKLKLAILELESKKAELESNRELLYFKLEELTGMPVAELKAIQFKLAEVYLDKESATEMNRKELNALEASQKAYEYVLKKEKGAKLPQVFGFANVSYLNAFDNRLTVKDLPHVGDLKLKGNHIMFA